MIFKISLDILCDKHLAEDATQETAYKIVKYCDRIKLFNRDEQNAKKIGRRKRKNEQKSKK